MWDLRLRALSFQHRLDRQVTSLRMFGEVLLWSKLILQSLGKVPHLLSWGCLECDLGGGVNGEGVRGGGESRRQSTPLKISGKSCFLQNDFIWNSSTVSWDIGLSYVFLNLLVIHFLLLFLFVFLPVFAVLNLPLFHSHWLSISCSLLL